MAMSLWPHCLAHHILYIYMYKATHGTAPSYLSQLVRVADLPGRRSHRSAGTNRLLTVRETVYRRRPGLPGRRTHHLEQPAGQRDICPVSVNLLSPSKSFLFQASFPDFIIDTR